MTLRMVVVVVVGLTSIRREDATFRRLRDRPRRKSTNGSEVRRRSTSEAFRGLDRDDNGCACLV